MLSTNWDKRKSKESVPMTMHTAYIGLGTNLGDRVQNIYRALSEVAQYAHISATSFLYETPPAYVTDQPPFLNSVCQIETNLSPHELLAALESTMSAMGRIRDVRFGPRIIDLDILFYENAQINTPDLVIPHPLLAERGFVLGPLCDIDPTLVHPVTGKTVIEHWNQLSHDSRQTLLQVTPVGDKLWPWGQKTYVMGIVNVTPDSFSGDGLATGNRDDHIERAVMQAQRFAGEGADCLDIGGQSTRPGHELVSLEEEIQRVVPAVEAIRAAVDLPISVDSFRAEVAEAALATGAHMLNDVWGLGFQQRIGEIAAQSRVPLILMHNRMATGYANQLEIEPGPAYEYEDITVDVCCEVAERLSLAQTIGVPRWNLISDPGIGFGKTQAQQLTLINQLDQLRELGYPILFGASRKSFIGKILGDLPPQERIEGTLATNVLAIARGADIVRVHDVKETVRAVQVADAIIRTA